MEIDADEFRERIGFGTPAAGVRLLGAKLLDQGDAPPSPAKPPKKGQSEPEGPEEIEDKSTARLCPSCGGIHALASDHRDEVDIIADEALAHWQKDLEPILGPLEALFRRAQSYDELIAGLEDMEAKLDVGPLADRLGKLLMQARGLGDTGEGR